MPTSEGKRLTKRIRSSLTTQPFDRFIWLPAVAFALTVLNLSFISEDMWDGVVFAYGLEVGDLRGWERNLDESGWEIAAPLVLLASALGEVLGGNYFLGYKVIVSLALAAITHEVYKLLKDTLSLPKPWPAIGATLVISSSVWTAVSASAMIWHVVAIPLALFGVRLLYSKGRTFFQILGTFPLLLAFSVNSILLFAPALAFVYESARNSKENGRFRWAKPTWRLYTLLSIGILYAAVMELLNPKFGRYSDYNQIGDVKYFNQLVLAAQSFFWFFSMLIPFFVGAVALYLISRKSTKGGTLTLSKLSVSRNTVVSTILLLSAAGPYILVGKAPIFYEVWDYQGRHGFLFAIASAVLFVSLISTMVSHGEASIKLVAILTTGLIAFGGFVGQALGYSLKVDRLQYDAALIEELSSTLPNVPEGLVYFEPYGGPYLNHPSGSILDLQYMMYRSTGKAHWQAVTPLTADNAPNLMYRNDEVDNLRDIYSPNQAPSKCFTRLLLLGEGWGTPFGPVIRILLAKDPPRLTIRNLGPKCVL
jgi:hypothetical protein